MLFRKLQNSKAQKKVSELVHSLFMISTNLLYQYRVCAVGGLFYILFLNIKCSYQYSYYQFYVIIFLINLINHRCFILIFWSHNIGLIYSIFTNLRNNLLFVFIIQTLLSIILNNRSITLRVWFSCMKVAMQIHISCVLKVNNIIF